ncbi:MAG: M1 family aminopeptidase [Bacteroidia bacterium]|nr:M1 family aminopeptidase [Bacteroidia bacterium]
MKKREIFLKRIFLFFLIITGFTVLFSQTDITRTGSYACSQKKINRPFSMLMQKSLSTPVHSFDVLHYDIYVDIFNCYNPAMNYPHSYTGTVKITFKADSTINSLNLDANSNSIVIDSVSLAGISFTHSNNILNVALNQTFVPGQWGSVMIYYHHLDVTDNAFYATSGFVFTDCEPEGARSWFPCWDKPSDKATLDLRARVPLNVKLGSNGILQDSTIIGNSLIYHWVSQQNIATYLIVITSNVNYHLDIVNWTDPTNPNKHFPFRFYYNDGEDPSYIESIIGNITTFYTHTFCDHPFDKNGFATLNDLFAWGGMENQTLTSLCSNCWDEGYVAHEFAHQWFGDMITCGTWADIWLNEGFATYCEALWSEHAYGDSTYKQKIISDAQYYFNNNPGWPISDPSWAQVTPGTNTLFNYAITYAKGACVLYMLRNVLGDSVFFHTIHEYAIDTINFKYQNAVTEDFTTKINNVTGQDYSWFINEWIYHPDHPVYSNVYSFVHELSGEWNVYFSAHQTQATPFFKMPMEIKIIFADQTDTIMKVMNDTNDQLFVFSFIKEPAQVIFDPDNKIVLKEDTLLVGVEEVTSKNPVFSLLACTPNVSSDFTMINYELAQNCAIRLSVADMSGKETVLINGQTETRGLHQFKLNLTNLKPGMYFCRLDALNYSGVQKFIVIGNRQNGEW